MKLNGIKRLLEEYGDAYSQCVEKQDFTRMQKKKELVQQRFRVLHKMIYPELKVEQMEELDNLKNRFFQDPKRHFEVLKKDIVAFSKEKGLSGRVTLNPEAVIEICARTWPKIEKRLRKNPLLIDTLIEMERTGGEPDVIWYDEKKDKYSFVDCSEDSPHGRIYLCYDKEAQNEAEQSGYSPKGNVIDMAKKMGIKVLTKSQYLKLQELIPVDTGTHSWIKTSARLRKEGEALVGTRFEDGVDVSGLEADDCHFGLRGFRGVLTI